MIFNPGRMLVIVVLACVSNTATAQALNEPKHIPNRFKNKVNHVRLMEITEANRVKDAADEVAEETADRIGFSRHNNAMVINPHGGCSINVGNTAGNRIGFGGPREVIVTGPVINYCK